jgi:hypothetical protein
MADLLNSVPLTSLGAASNRATSGGARPLVHHDQSGYATTMKLSLLLSLVPVMLAGVMLSGCAADTMRKYVGQDIRTVELDYGPPVNQIDLGGGTRAYQWRKVSVDTTPATAVTTTDKDSKGRKTTSTQIVGGDQTVNTCLYTFIATWDPQRNAWFVTGFREPSFDCAIGGLS